MRIHKQKLQNSVAKLLRQHVGNLVNQQFIIRSSRQIVGEVPTRSMRVWKLALGRTERSTVPGWLSTPSPK